MEIPKLIERKLNIEHDFYNSIFQLIESKLEEDLGKDYKNKIPNTLILLNRIDAEFEGKYNLINELNSK